jgi:hypothetical protein
MADNDFLALGSAIYACLGSASSALPVFQSIAPQGQATPYVVFNRQAGVDDYTFTSKELSTDYTVKVVDDDKWPTDALRAYGTVHSTMQDARLTLTGFTLLRARRNATLNYQDQDGFWHIGGIYRIDVQD